MGCLQRFSSHQYRPLRGVATLLLPATFLTVAAGREASAQTVFFGQDSPRGALVNSIAARNQFLGSLTVSETNNLESFTNGQTAPTLSFNTLGYTAATSGPSAVIRDQNVGVATTATAVSGSKFFTALSQHAITFDFNSTTTGFGLFLIDAGTVTGFPSNVFFELTNTAANTSKIVFASPPGVVGVSNNVAFFGVTDLDNPFDRVRIGGAARNDLNIQDGISYDDITVGVAASPNNIPEPTTGALAAGIGMAALAVRRSRRRS